MLRSFKTEINPSKEQITQIDKTIGTCRYVYNFYLAHNKEIYDKDESFMSGKSFSVWLNNEYLPNNPDKQWIKEASSKSVKNLLKMDILLFLGFLKARVDFLDSRRRINLMLRCISLRIILPIVIAKDTE